MFMRFPPVCVPRLYLVLTGEPLTKNHCDLSSHGDHSIDDMFSWYSSQTINEKVSLCVVNYLLQNHVVQ